MIVVDCSAIVSALVDEPPDKRLLFLLAAEDLQAPALLDFEVASALRGHAMAGKLGGDRLDEAISDFEDLDIERHPMTELLRHVLALRDNFTAYDAFYVVLAKALGAPLVTLDAKMRQAARLGVAVELLR